MFPVELSIDTTATLSELFEEYAFALLYALSAASFAALWSFKSRVV